MVPLSSHKVSRVSWYSGCTWKSSHFVYGAITLYGGSFQSSSTNKSQSVVNFQNPWPENRSGLGCSPFARRYLGNRVFFLFLRVLRCFSSPGSPHCTMYSCRDIQALPCMSFLIRKSSDQRLLAPPRRLSQLTTSLIGSWRQGIHLTLLITWPIRLHIYCKLLCCVLSLIHSRTSVRSLSRSIHASDFL